MPQPPQQPRGRKIVPGHQGGHPKTATSKAEWKAVFLEELEATKSISAAADKAQRSRRTCYREKKEDPAFSEAWDEAWERVVDELEQTMMDQGINGYAEPVFQGGSEVGTRQVYSPHLQIFMLKNNRGSKYKESVQVAVTADEYAKHVREALAGQDDEAKKALEENSSG